MAYIALAKKPNDFDGHMGGGTTETRNGPDGKSYTCYRVSSNITYQKSFNSGVKEIWWNIWVSLNGAVYNDTARFFIRSASTNVHLYNTAVTINGSSAGSISESYISTNSIFPMQFHVKSNANDGLVEIFINGESVFSSTGINVLNGDDITQVDIYCRSGNSMYIRDCIVATHEIPCGQLLEEVTADATDLNGWTQSGNELSTETAGATFTMKPNAAELATLQASKAIDGIAPIFTGSASANISALTFGGDETIQLESTSVDTYGKVRNLADVTSGLQVVAVA